MLRCPHRGSCAGRQAGHDVRRPVEDVDEVQQVLAVRPDLRDRVQHRSRAVRRLDDQLGFALVQRSPCPLLELDDEVGGCLRPRVLAGQDDVDALAAEGQRVLDQHLHATQAGTDEVLGEHRQAALSAAQLRVGRPPTHGVAHLLGDADAQGAFRASAARASASARSNDKTRPQGSTKGFVRWGTCPGEEVRRYRCRGP